MKLSNTARSIAALSAQASLLVPLSIPSVPLPAYINMDPRSLWHVSALLSTAVESMTLPSRLKAKDGMRESLDEIAASLNVNGNQNIAKLQMSIGPERSTEEINGDLRPGRPDLRIQSRDSRMPSQDGRELAVKPVNEDGDPLDMDFFPLEEPNTSRRRQVTKKLHIFGQAEAFRGDNEDSQDDDFDGQERARRRAAGLSIIHRLVLRSPYAPHFIPLFTRKVPRILPTTHASLAHQNVSACGCVRICLH